MTKRIKVFFHRNKEDNWDLAEKLGFEENSSEFNALAYLGYEIETYFDVDTETGIATLVGAEGFFLGDEAVTPGEVEDLDE